MGTLDELLKNFGLSSESVHRIRLSRGVVGKTTYAVVALFVVLAMAAYRAGPTSVSLIAIIASVAFVIYFIGVLLFAVKNPGAALLEGAELLHWQQIELASKGSGPITVDVNRIASVPPDRNALSDGKTEE